MSLILALATGLEVMGLVAEALFTGAYTTDELQRLARRRQRRRRSDRPP